MNRVHAASVIVISVVLAVFGSVRSVCGAPQTPGGGDRPQVVRLADELLDVLRAGDLSDKHCTAAIYVNCPGLPCPTNNNGNYCITCTSFFGAQCQTSGTGVSCLVTTIYFCQSIPVGNGGPRTGSTGTCNNGICAIDHGSANCGAAGFCP